MVTWFRKGTNPLRDPRGALASQLVGQVRDQGLTAYPLLLLLLLLFYNFFYFDFLIIIIIVMHVNQIEVLFSLTCYFLRPDQIATCLRPWTQAALSISMCVYSILTLLPEWWRGDVSR